MHREVGIMANTQEQQQPRGPFCQSCAMPLAKPEDFGTEASGVRSNDYCAYCYKDGAFVTPNMTMEQMRDFCVDKMVELGVMPRDQATTLMRQTMPKLKRWSSGRPS
jgi:hypothetical protein